MNISLRRPVAALAGCIAIALSACGGSSSSSSGSSGGGGAIDPPLTAPTISAQAENQSVVKGETATFKVVATGSALTYQWKKNGTDISGATSSSYTTPPTNIADNNTVFSVSVSNSAGSVSSNATLTVSDTAVAPAITSQPADQTAITGQTVTFSVTATGTSLQYQWKKGDTVIPGATSSSYTTPATSSADNDTKYSVIVSNKVSTVTSNMATLTVSDTAMAPAITTQPAAQSVTAGQTATFSVTATGTGTLSYQWKKNGINITGGMGATSNSYTTPAMGYAGNGAVYSVVVTDSVGTTTSSNATLTVSKSSTAKSYGYVANASDGLYDKTECVQDNNTGLIWEGKTASPATSRLGTSTYTNYDDANSAQKYNGSAYVNPTPAEIDASTNSIGYRNSVRTLNLCGYTDWRLPTKEELQGILASSGSPRIDTAWFPNTQESFYWSSSPYVGNSDDAWNVNFVNGYVYDYYYRNYGYAVRLVRASQ